MAYEFHCRQRVEFADTDMAGIVHFSNFFRYMERAEHEFLRSLGLSVHAVNGDDLVSWPRVSAECKFRAPLSFEDELDVHLLVRAEAVEVGHLRVPLLQTRRREPRWPSVRSPWSACRSIAPPGG